MTLEEITQLYALLLDLAEIQPDAPVWELANFINMNYQSLIEK